MSVISISAPVGLNAANRYQDVINVQVMLNHFIGNRKLLGYNPLQLDGKCGPKTREAIMAFQFQNGLVSEEHFSAQVRPHGMTISYMNKNAGHIPSTGSGKPATEWVLDDTDAWKIRTRHGQDIYDWAVIPPDGKEAKEFAAPGSIRANYESVIMWKSLDARKDCPFMRQPYKNIQGIELLRTDRAYWEARTKGSVIKYEILRTAATTLNRDYRDLVVGSKMCPPAAHNKLLQINKDVTYQLFLGMFRLLQPQAAGPVPGGPYYQSAVSSVPEAVNMLIEKLSKN